MTEVPVTEVPVTEAAVIRARSPRELLIRRPSARDRPAVLQPQRLSSAFPARPAPRAEAGAEPRAAPPDCTEGCTAGAGGTEGSGGTGDSGGSTGTAGRSATRSRTGTVHSPVGPLTSTAPSYSPATSGWAMTRAIAPSCSTRSQLTPASATATRAIGGPLSVSSPTAGPASTVPRSSASGVTRGTAASTPRRAASETFRLSSSTMRCKACHAAYACPRSGSRNRPCRSSTTPNRVAVSGLSIASSSSAGSGVAVTRRTRLRAISSSPWEPKVHICGFWFGVTRWTRSVTYPTSSVSPTQPSPSRSASPVVRPSTTAPVNTDGLGSAPAASRPSSNAYSIALDAVITTRPRPPPTVSWPANASRTWASPAARTTMPRGNAPP